jgi:hypothetical protein
VPPPLRLLDVSKDQQVRLDRPAPPEKMALPDWRGLPDQLVLLAPPEKMALPHWRGLPDQLVLLAPPEMMALPEWPEPQDQLVLLAPLVLLDLLVLLAPLVLLDLLVLLAPLDLLVLLVPLDLLDPLVLLVQQDRRVTQESLETNNTTESQRPPWLAASFIPALPSATALVFRQSSQSAGRGASAIFNQNRNST